MDKYLNTTTGHMILGGLLVLFFSPVFALLDFPYFLTVFLVSTLGGVIKEIGDFFKWWSHEDSNFRKALNDIAEWTFGGVVFTTFITITKYGIN